VKNRILFISLAAVLALSLGLIGCDGGGVKYDLTIASTAGGSTTPGVGTSTYNEGQVVNLKATPDANYHFVNWTGDVAAIADVNDATTTITMNGDYSITANFEGVETITIGFNHIWPATSFQQTVQFERYFAMVEEEADGKYDLKIDWYPVGTLLAGAEIFQGVAAGTVDAGCSVNAYTATAFPVMVTLSQSGVAPPKNSQAGSMTAWEFYKFYNPQEYKDVKILYLFNTPPGWLHCEPGLNVTKLAQMQGLRVRATGASSKGITAVGATPVGGAQGDVVTLAKAGDIDANIAPLETLITYSQQEVFDSSTFVPFFYSECFYVIMNWDFWDDLPADLQAAFDAVAEDAVKEAGQIWQYKEGEFKQQAIADYGHTFLELDPAEQANWVAALAGIGGEYAATLDGKGFDGDAIVAKAKELAAKNNAITWPEFTP
jgi:TRAP-type C4-dicarboxylate transport system substrate-binding protein